MLVGFRVGCEFPSCCMRAGWDQDVTPMKGQMKANLGMIKFGDASVNEDAYQLVFELVSWIIWVTQVVAIQIFDIFNPICGRISILTIFEMP